MRTKHRLALLVTFLLLGCQPSTPRKITIIDGENIAAIQTDERVPSAILAEAGITLAPEDRILLNGNPASLESPITNYPITLQIRRAAPITLSTPQGGQTIQTSAFTVGEALQEAGIQMRAGDQSDQLLQSPVSSLEQPVTIYQLQPLTITTDRKTITVFSSAQTIGEALAEAGIPLVGGDYSLPSENEALPADGNIKVVRVSESVLLAQKPIPFTSELIASAEVPLDQTQILQPGENGLTIQRIRVRYENGVEVARVTEDETVVRPPKNRVLGYGTKIEIKTAVVDGVSIEYWRAVQMYVTSYSPCRSGGDRCYTGTSSGATVKKGVVGMRYDWYLSMGGQGLYIPGYGFATVEDVCGGCVGKPWIDVAYSDSDYEPWSSWVTVYFLTPVPANIIYVLE
jgi:uncharacterized protein YabE (DUF348 family)